MIAICFIISGVIYNSVFFMIKLKIIISIITGMLIFSSCTQSPGKDSTYRAVNGYIDISGHDFRSEKSIKLDGEWEFYWNRLLTPADFSSLNPPLKTGNITVPSYWNGFNAGSGPLSGDGCATYRLKIKLKKAETLYALRIRHMYTAYTLWADNQIIAANGKVGMNINSMEAQFLPQLAFFHSHSDEVQLVLQISNFYHAKGGFQDTITIGHKDIIRHDQLLSQILEMFLFGVLVIMVIYYLSFYIMNIKDRTFLYFSLLCLVFALRIPFLGERLFIDFFPWFSWELNEKISFLTINLGLVTGNLYLYWLLKESYSKTLKNFLTAIGSGLCLLVIFSFSRFYWYSMFVSQAFILIWMVYGIYLIIKTSMIKKEGFAFLIAGISITLVSSLIEILYILKILSFGPISRYGLFIFIITQALMLSYRYSRTFKKIESLSRDKAGLFSSSIQIISSLILDSSTRLYEKTQDVARISVMLARKLGYNHEKTEEIKIAALLHDIGMIGVQNISSGISADISEDDIRMIENHPKRSIDIISNLKELDGVKTIIEQHHESYDGRGFPAGIKGNAINEGAQIIRIADDYFTLFTLPEYQDTDRKDKVIKYFEEQKGKAYNPAIADEFILLLNDEEIFYDVHKDDITESEDLGIYTWKMPSAIHMEGYIITRVIDRLKSLVNINTETLNSIEFSLGEIVRNAIIHGNKYDSGKFVTVKLRVNGFLFLDSDYKKIEMSVADEGEGIDFNAYNRFKQLRADLGSAIKFIKEQKDSIADEEKKKAFATAIKNFDQFQLKYFFDFNTFMQKKTPYSTGGVGLLYVLRMFDNVEFRKITDEHRVCGMEVVMEKIIPA